MVKQETVGSKMANLGKLQTVRLKKVVTEWPAGKRCPKRGQPCRVQRDKRTQRGKLLCTEKNIQNIKRENVKFYMVNFCLFNVFYKVKRWRGGGGKDILETYSPKPDFFNLFKCWLICFPVGDFGPCFISLSELSASPFLDSDPLKKQTLYWNASRFGKNQKQS